MVLTTEERQGGGLGDAVMRIDGVSLTFGGVNALSNVSLDVKNNEILAIIGPNGAGKTALLNCISGFYKPQKGEIYFHENKITRAEARQAGPAGHRPHLPEHRALYGAQHPRQSHGCPPCLHEADIPGRGHLLRPGASRRHQASPDGRRDHRFPGDSIHPQTGGGRPCPTDCARGWSWAGPWPWSPKCFSWTSRWPA